MTDDLDALIQAVLARTRTEACRKAITDLLLEICRIDTTPNSDVNVMRAAESDVFDVLERELAELSFAQARSERRCIDPAIAGHPAFSLLHFTKTADRPGRLTPEQAYAGRGNLVWVLPGCNAATNARGVAVNAHIDVVAPYFPPHLDKGIVYGRGACDDKGQVVAILAALRVLSEVLARNDRRFVNDIVAMFVIEEEPGGNGSLALAVDRKLKELYDSVLVMEAADNAIHPANRGAVWYRAELCLDRVSAFEMSAFVIEEMEKEGRAIKAESRHDLFPQRPVQTCHGVIGRYGEHPSRICGEVAFHIDCDADAAPRAEPIVRDCLEAALAEYVAAYGDKTRAIDPATNRPKVERHYDLRPGRNGFLVEVHGSTGHMGSILENDGAITKAACMLRSLARSTSRIEALARTGIHLRLADMEATASLVLEGGQGFVPTHDIEEIMSRMRRAAERGAEAYLRLIGRDEKGSAAVTVTYDKLHNAAFDGDPDSAPMRNAIAAAKSCGVWKDRPVVGWNVSCDARLFATEYPGMPVLTAGPGSLAHAHSDEEQISIDELRQAVEFLAIYLLMQVETA